MSLIAVSEVDLVTADGCGRVLRLHAAMPVPAGVSARDLCRLVVPRLPVSPFARVMLGMLLDELFSGMVTHHTYAELGAAMGRCGHTAVRSAAELRSAGLLLTSRAGIGGRIRFNCTPLLAWASSVVFSGASQDARERPSGPSEAVAGTCTGAGPAASPDASCAAPETCTSGDRSSDCYFDEIEDDHPDWPSVPGNWRHLMDIPLPHEDNTSLSVPLHVKPWLGGIPRGEDGALDMEKLLRMPYQLVAASGDDEAIHVFCQEKGDRQEGPAEFAKEDHDVDASEEREAEIALAGRNRDTGDSFEFSTGSESPESDVGHGVVANPDL